MKVINCPIFSYKNSGKYDLDAASSKNFNSAQPAMIKQHDEYHFCDAMFNYCHNKWIRDKIINKIGFVEENKLSRVDCNDLKSNEKVIQAQLDALPIPLLALEKITDVNPSSMEVCNIVRRIVTLLSGLTFCKSVDVSDKAKAFLDKDINGKNVKSFGDSNSIAPNELKFIQEEAMKINAWIGTIDLTGLAG